MCTRYILQTCGCNRHSNTQNVEVAFEMFLILLTTAVLLKVVHPAPVTNEVRLLSQQSGRFVHVADNGAIKANGNQKSSSVFNMYLKNSQIQFELKNKPGMFLMLKELNHTVYVNSSSMNVTTNQTISHEYTLVVDFPSEPYLTEWEKSGPCGALVQKVDESTNCFVAFDSSGKVAGPCHLLSTNLASCVSVVPASP